MSLSNQDNQGTAPAIVAAPAGSPVAAEGKPNATQEAAQQALAAGKPTVPQPETDAVEQAAAKSITIGDDGKAKPTVPTTQEAAVDEVIYDSTGDPGMDMALGFVGKLGLKPDHPAMVKASEGDFSFIKAHMATLGDKARGWEQHIALAEKSYADNVKTAQANDAAIEKAVYSAAGGKASWDAIEAWAKANADEAEKKYINGMLADNPVTAQAAVLLLQKQYQAATGTKVLGKPTLKGDLPAGGDNSVVNGPLSPKEYAKEVQKLNSRSPGSVDSNSPEYQQLQQRARAFRR